MPLSSESICREVAYPQKCSYCHDSKAERRYDENAKGNGDEAANHRTMFTLICDILHDMVKVIGRLNIAMLITSIA